MSYALDFQNEAERIAYPFVENSTSIPNNVFIDAKFQVLGDKAVYLSSIDVGDTTVVFNFKIGDLELSKSISYSGFSEYNNYSLLDGTNYVGVIQLGSGVDTIKDNYGIGSITTNLEFCRSVICNIPIYGGVFAINGLSGVVTVSTDTHTFFEKDGQNITLNAVGIPASIGQDVLKTLNGVSPTSNNIIIKDSDLLRFNAVHNTLTTTLIGNAFKINKTVLQ